MAPGLIDTTLTEEIKNKYVLFWGGMLSNFYPTTFNTEGITYNCSEQYYMAMKAKHFGDVGAYFDIMNATQPHDQKAIGRRVKGFDEEKWHKVSRDIMYDACYAKFTQNEKLKEYLLSTKEKILVEASPYDKIWGIGLSESDPQAYFPSLWRGKNWLGYILMLVREDISLGVVNGK